MNKKSKVQTGKPFPLNTYAVTLENMMPTEIVTAHRFEVFRDQDMLRFIRDEQTIAVFHWKYVAKIVPAPVKASLPGMDKDAESDEARKQLEEDVEQLKARAAKK